MKKPYLPFYIISLLFGIFWLLTTIWSFFETFIYGYMLADIPAIAVAISDLTNANSPTDVSTYIGLILFGPFVMPLAFMIAGIFIPVIGLYFLIFCIVGIVIVFFYMIISMGLIAIAAIMALLVIIISIVCIAKSPKKTGHYTCSLVFAILGLVSMFFTGAPAIFALSVLTRNFFILVGCILMIVGFVMGKKAHKKMIEQDLDIIK